MAQDYDSNLELLKFAAKAIGNEFGVIHGGPRIRCDAGWTPWNPLSDDSDALRLAVKLNLAVVFHPTLNQALCRPYYTRDMGAESREDGEKHADPYAATRRAIVRAAAEIGRNMK